MATLEKIRSKSVLLIVVIGVALLAFIIGDAITNSRNLFGDNTTVAKVGKTKIEYADYARKREELNSQIENARRQNPAQYANYDSQVLAHQALAELLSEAMIDQAAEDAGIRATDNQISYYIYEQPINPRMNEIMQQLYMSGHQAATPAAAYELIFNPTRNGITEAEMAPFQSMWNAMQNETAQLVKRHTYLSLLDGTIKANDLDKQALYQDYINTRNVDIVYQPYENFSDDKYKATDDEVKAEYESQKGKYQVDELTKDIAFIAVQIATSDADKAAASQLAQQTADVMRQGETFSKELRKEGIVEVHHRLREQDLPRNIKEFVKSAPVDSVAILADNINGFTVVKKGNHAEEIDSLQINFVQVVGNLANETLTALNAGLEIDSLSTRFPADSLFVQKEQWIALYNAQGKTGQLEESQVDTLLNAGGKYITLVSNPQASLIAKVTQKSSPKSIYEFSQVDYSLKPSTATVSEIRTKLEDFLAANTNSKSFIENAAKEGYALSRLSLNATTPAVPRIPGLMNNFYPDSRQVVRWVVIDGKPGEVSHIYESKDAMKPAMYAAAVISEYDDYTPLNNADIKNALAERVQKSKVGDELMSKYSSQTASMETAAQAMGREVRNNPSFIFGRNSQVRDAAVIGKIAGSQPGKVVLVKGDNGIYAYQITATGQESFPYNEEQYAQQYHQLVNVDLIEMLRGGKEYKNNIYKFESGD